MEDEVDKMDKVDEADKVEAEDESNAHRLHITCRIKDKEEVIEADVATMPVSHLRQ